LTPTRVEAQSCSTDVHRPRTLALWPLAVPCALLVAGGLIGYPLSLDQRVAIERLAGLLAASLVAVGAMSWLRRRVVRPDRVLVLTSLAALAGGLWVISVSGPDVFRGIVGNALDLAFGPLFGLAKLTDPVEISNTRFIVGYNGLADLCLVAIFACGALLLGRPGAQQAIGLAAVVAVALVLLVGTGARGGLTGLAAGICAAALFAWPRRYALLALLAAPIVLALAAISILDKGLEFSSTAGRVTYWSDLLRLLVEYPLTGVGLGVDTANRVALQYEINPDPERVFYAHNTFVQSYLEQGPLGALGMLALPLVAVAAALIARRHGVRTGQRALLIAGLGVLGGMEAHGLTDQVITTNVGTAMLLLATAAILAALTDQSLRALSRLARRASIVLCVFAALSLAASALTSAGRAQVLLNVGGLETNQALAASPQSSARASKLADAEAVLLLALGQDDSHPAVLRQLAAVRSARFDDSGGLDALSRAAASPRIDAFDMLQIAHGYRDLGFAAEAYSWASRAYAAWGRAPEDAVMQRYAQATLTDTRAKTLATQAEAAMRARHFSEAQSLFEQALSFESESAYLIDRIGAAQRAVAKYGG
jgi:O-antigen ligase/polysaccharide polymerase Wzy-like membrane protein